MIPKECKRLAEVDFPIAEVSKHAAREKSIRHGHPSTLHLWWARRPLASCRAMLMALLLPDPCDEHCPEDFKTAAQDILLSMHSRPTGWAKEVEPPEGLRKVLLKFIGDFANWDNSADKDYLETARALIKAAHPEETPLVVDPFAGGGSIPLEALRLGCETFASDLNPVACLILKVMLEDIPRHGPDLAKDLRREGKEIKEKAEKELAGFYPNTPILTDNFLKGSFVLFKKKEDGFSYTAVGNVEKHLLETQENYTHFLQIEKGAEHGPNFGLMFKDWNTIEKAGARSLDLKWETPIAYLWARTVKCESPNCGAEIPLMRSFWLCKKANRKRALRYQVKRQNVQGKSPEVEFEIFEPKTDKEVHGGTVTRAKAMCLCCGTVLPPERVRTLLSEQCGGADVVFDTKGNRFCGARMLAVVTLVSGVQGRNYRLPAERDYQAVWKAQKMLKTIIEEWEHSGTNGLCPVPDEPLPPIGTLGFRVQRYGMLQWGHLFTARQKVALVALAKETRDAVNSVLKTLIALLIGKGADGNSSLCRWMPSSENPVNQFSRQALPIVWDFCESAPASKARGVFLSATSSVAEVIRQARSVNIGQAQQADACESPLPSDTVTTWFTDPPYYDAIPYSDLSDFFLTWMRRTLPDHPSLRDPFDPENPLSPKNREAVQDETRFVNGQPKDRAFFEEAMAKAFAEGRRVLKEDGVGAVVFAHKTTEGWEALLSGLILGGWTITGSWPISTEAENRLRARDSAALATSVHLVCRPRPKDAPVGDWGEVLRELPNRVGDWMERLQGEGVRGADLVFACIGPALEIYSRYSKVVDPEEREILLGGDPEAKEPHKRGYLAYVWETVGRMALEQVLGTEDAQARNGAAGALEEDARLTALFLWTLQSTNGNGEGKNKKVKGKSAEEEIDKNEDEDAPRGKVKGYSLVFDVARRFAQPLGIDLPKWENRIIKTEKGVVRLLPVSERAKQLFGEEGAKAAADWIEEDPVKNLQRTLFPELEKVSPPKIRSRGRGKISIDPSAIDSESMREATTLDRVHAAMLLQAGGQTNALRSLIKAEQDRSPDFLRLANALSALYPKGSEEKRLLDAMLLAVPR